MSDNKYTLLVFESLPKVSFNTNIGKILAINVTNEKYLVESRDLGSEFQYKISTDCNYIMTVSKNDDGDWSANEDVQVLDNALVNLP